MLTQRFNWGLFVCFGGGGGMDIIAYGKCALIKNLDQPNLMYANLGINTQANSVGAQNYLASYQQPKAKAS